MGRRGRNLAARRKFHQQLRATSRLCWATKKVRHPTETAAEHAAARREVQGGTYRCPHCRAWHVTREKKRGRNQ